jgi:DNA uptake protein ComE-like DNA-binding protein
MYHYNFILLIICTSYIIQAQESQLVDTSNVSEEMQWEKILDITTQDEEYSSFAEEVEQLEGNPIDLNTSSVEELHRIPMLTNLVALRIVKKRNITPFASVDELLNIDGVTPEILSLIRKFIKIDARRGSIDIGGSFTSRTSTEIERRSGFINNSYPGSPIKALNKFHLFINNNESPLSDVITKIEIGALIEKDPGEQNLNSYSTGYGSLSIVPISTHLIIGDYHVEAAEGLVLWCAYGISKGSEVVASVHKNGSGIKQRTSSDENSFLRGVAADIKISSIQFQLIYSNKLINATIDSMGRISNIDRSGLFRTENEIQKQNATEETILGCRTVVYPFNGLKIGGTGYCTRFTNPLIMKGTNGLTASYLSIQGVDLSFSTNKFEVFSEYAMDRSSEIAMIIGTTYEPVSAFAMTVVARKYPSSFQSIHGSAFGESNGQVQNENGLYVGIRFRPIKWLWVSTYYDQFKYPRFTQFIPTSANGNDFLTLAECKITNSFKFVIRVKRKDTPSIFEDKDIFGRIIQCIATRVQENYRFTSEFESSPCIRLVSRIEWTNINYSGMKKAEQGFLLSQSIRWTSSYSLTLQTRLAAFQTDSYDSRIYEFEDDLPYVFSNPAHFDRGLRWFFALKYKLFLHVTVSAKYSQLIKEGAISLGTNLDEIKGDSQSNVSIQIDVRF